VPTGAPVESSSVAWACRNQCQFTPCNLSLSAAGLSWRLSRLRRLSGEPFRAQNTRVDGAACILHSDYDQALCLLADSANHRPSKSIGRSRQRHSIKRPVLSYMRSARDDGLHSEFQPLSPVARDLVRSVHLLWQVLGPPVEIDQPVEGGTATQVNSSRVQRFSGG
jgi:hypothetical protein